MPSEVPGTGEQFGPSESPAVMPVSESAAAQVAASILPEPIIYAESVGDEQTPSIERPAPDATWETMEGAEAAAMALLNSTRIHYKVVCDVETGKYQVNLQAPNLGELRFTSEQAAQTTLAFLGYSLEEFRIVKATAGELYQVKAIGASPQE